MGQQRAEDERFAEPPSPARPSPPDVCQPAPELPDGLPTDARWFAI